MIKSNRYSLTTLAAAGVLTASFGLGHLSVSKAQYAPPAPAADRARPLPPGGPRGERPPGPDAGLPPAQPVDPKVAPTAVKTASDALAGLTAGHVWARTAPRGEQEVQATLVFSGKDVARLDFDPASGALRARGEGRPLPPPAPPGPGAPVPLPPDAKVPAPGADAPMPPAPDANAPAPVTTAPVNLDPIKANLVGIVKGLSISQGAEVMPREGFWKVAIISGNRVVGELHVSGDGLKVMEDFAAARDAAIFAR